MILNKEVKEVLRLILIIGLFYLLLQTLGITCPVKYVTGISCPGCGMTRAMLSALSLNFDKAFYYHPLFPIVPIGAFILLFQRRIKHSAIYLGIIVAAFFAVYFYRLLYNTSPVVIFDPAAGAIVKTITIFFNL